MGHLEFGITPPMALYRLYDEQGTLLYVGVTGNLPKRLWVHARRDWWHSVCRTRVEWIASREDALIAEAKAIESESPLHNITGSRAHLLASIRQVRRHPTRQDGTVLQDLRLSRLLNLTEAAKAIGCHAKTLENLEKEHIGASEIMLRRLADAYGVTPDQIRKKAAA